MAKVIGRRCNYYRIEFDTTHHFDKEWLDGIEKECGVRPEISQVVIATPDVGHYLCSAQKTTALWEIQYTLINFCDLEEAGADAENIEDLVRDSGGAQGGPEYQHHRNFWSDYLPEDWDADQIIPDKDWSVCKEGPWIEHVGTIDYNEMNHQIAYDMFLGEYEGEGQDG